MNEGHSASRRRFAELAGRRNEELDLALAALLIASEEYPELDIESYLSRLDRLAVELDEKVDLAGNTYVACKGLSDFLAGQHGFRGDDENYYDARNSYLNQVMERALGTPVSLGILYLEVARRVGMNLRPILFPAHFLLRLRARRGSDIFIDPYNGGRLLDLDGCRALLADLYANSRAFSETLVAPGTRKQVLSRLLQDLKFIYLRDNNAAKALRTIELMTLLSPWDLDQIRDRGLLYSRLGHTQAAIADLKAYLKHAPPGSPMDTVKETLRRISAR